MSASTEIQWTDATWNLARGCTKVSEGCKFCYMMRDGDRYKYDGNKVVRTKKVFQLPLKLKEPKRIFTCSLTDFFHPDIDSFREEAWEIIRKCPQHTFQILTKRPERFKVCLPADWGNGYPNVWLGVSVENQASRERITLLALTPAKVRFLSVEPLLEKVDMHLNFTAMEFGKPEYEYTVKDSIHWVIIGGESGFGKVPNDPNTKWRYRECRKEWITSIIDQCNKYNIPVFVKQMGTHLAGEMGLKSRSGVDISEWPDELKIRNFPV